MDFKSHGLQGNFWIKIKQLEFHTEGIKLVINHGCFSFVLKMRYSQTNTHTHTHLPLRLSKLLGHLRWFGVWHFRMKQRRLDVLTLNVRSFFLLTHDTRVSGTQLCPFSRHPGAQPSLLGYNSQDVAISLPMFVFWSHIVPTLSCL